MAVFTEVTAEQAQALLGELDLGELRELRGIEGGIENTNYFATTSGRIRADAVRTADFEQLPFYLHLMKHLAQRGIAVPDPAANQRRRHPAHRVRQARRRGQPPARQERAGPRRRPLRRSGRPCWRACTWPGATSTAASPTCAACPGGTRPCRWSCPSWTPAGRLLRSELAYQNHMAAGSAYAALPRGPVHADLFRDNVLFDTDEASWRGRAFFDFYFAGVDTWLFDIAVCLNDWCIDLDTGAHDAGAAARLLQAYRRAPAVGPERRLLPAMAAPAPCVSGFRACGTIYLPREASMLKPHDPTHFERVLRQRVAHAGAGLSLCTTWPQPVKFVTHRRRAILPR
jgi:homoserine kinase type II